MLSGVCEAGQGWEVSGRVLLLGPLLPPLLRFFFEAQCSCYRQARLGPAQITLLRGRGCISSYKEETSRGGQDFLTLVCGSVPGLTPQEPPRRPCVLRKDLLSMPGGPLPWPAI